MTEEKRGSFVDLMQSYDLFGVLDDYLFSPAYSIIKGFKEGQKEADIEIDNYMADLNKQMAEQDRQRRIERMDDLAYETGLLDYQKSAIEIAKMVKPVQKRQQSKPRISASYKEYCCD